ncbi:ATP-binding protein [Herbidospora sp. RD11066]
MVGTFLGFSEGGLEFHADLILPYRNDFQSSPMHGQFIIVGLENDTEAVLGRITTISAQGRLLSGTGEDYALRQQREDRAIPEDLREQYLKYRVDIRILGVLRSRGAGEPPMFVPSHRRLPHVGAKVAFLSDDLLRHVAGAADEGDEAAELGFLAFGEFVFAGDDQRVGDVEWLEVRSPKIIPRFNVNQLVSRRSFVFARAGFGKSNLVKMQFANLYGQTRPPTTRKRDREVPVGTVIFDPDGEYYWPDDKGRPGLCDVPELKDRLVVFTDKEGDSAFYRSFIVDKVKLNIKELQAAKVVSLVIPAERQDQQNVAKLKQLRSDAWGRLVDQVWRERGGTDLRHICEALQLNATQEMEALAARANMVRIVNALHDPSSQLLTALVKALSDGKLCVVDISQMRGAQGLALAGVILQHLFDHNQAEFTKKDSRSIPTIAVIEEAQSVLNPTAAQGEGPFVSWVKEGRKYDLGAVLITQQPSSIPPEILSQGDNWFIFHLLSEGDLRAAKKANAHFSDDLLSSLLNEPIPGHGIFWSSAGITPYPIPIRAMLFENMVKLADPGYNRAGENCYASLLRKRLRQAVRDAVKATGGVGATVADQLDITEIFAREAIQQLADNADFQERVRSDWGYPWGGITQILEDALAGKVSGDRRVWIRQQRLDQRALLEILGPEDQAWVAERRPKAGDPRAMTTWVKATSLARPRREGVPRPPSDGESGDRHAPPPEGGLL